MSEFVILRHEMPAGSDRNSHWDFMLRDGDTLLTWALEIEPVPGISMVARRLPDHDLKYLEYEGNISHNRGCVKRIASGNYRWMERDRENGLRIHLTFETGKSDSSGEVLIRRQDNGDDAFQFF